MVSPNVLEGREAFEPHRFLSPLDVLRHCSIGVGRSQLARRLSSPPLKCMSECAHLMKAEQPRNLGYMHLAVVEVTNRQIAPQVLKYLTVCVRCRSEISDVRPPPAAWPSSPQPRCGAIRPSAPGREACSCRSPGGRARPRLPLRRTNPCRAHR